MVLDMEQEKRAKQQIKQRGNWCTVRRRDKDTGKAEAEKFLRESRAKAGKNEIC